MISDALPKLKTAFSAPWTAARAAIAAIAITALFFVGLLLLVRPGFEVNDDVAVIEMLMAGHIAPYVDSNYGSLLHLLYAHVSTTVPWYGIMLLGVLGLSAASLIGIVLCCYSGYARLLLLLLVLGLYLPFVITVDYSMVGILSGASTIIIAMVLMIRGTLSAHRALLLGVFAVVCMWVRLEGLVAAVAFTAPVGLMVLVMSWRWGRLRQLLKPVPILLFILPLILSCAADYMHKTYYSSPQYRDYTAWNTLRGKFHVYPISRININNPAVLQATGWTQQDYDNLLEWFFVDEDLYNVRSMEAFYASAKQPSLTALPPRYFLDELQYLVVDYGGYWVLLAGLLVLGLALAAEDGLRRWLALFMPIYVFLFIYGMAALLRYPGRVAEPSLTAFALAYLFSVLELRRTVRKEGAVRDLRLEWAAVALASCGLAWVVHQAYERRVQYLNAEFKYAQILDHLNTQYVGDYILIQPGRGMATQFQSPLEPVRMAFHPIEVGWQTFSPLFYDQIQALGVNKGSEMPAALVNNGNAFVMAHADWVDRVVGYLRDHDHMLHVRKEKVEQLGPKLFVFRLVNP